MRILSYFLTIFIQMKNWFTVETFPSMMYTRKRSASSSSSYKGSSTHKRLLKFYNASITGTYIATMLASTMSFSTGFSLSFYRLSLSPICHYISNPNCFHSMGEELVPSKTRTDATNAAKDSTSTTSFVINISCNTLALLLGLYVGCLLSNYYGRRKTMALSSVPTFLGWYLVLGFARARLSLLFYLAQSFNAFGAGLLLISTFIYLIEIGNRKQFSYISCCVSISIIVGFIFGWNMHIRFAPTVIYLYQDEAHRIAYHEAAVDVADESNVWPWLAFAGSFIALVNVAVAALIPESPQWLARVGDFDGAGCSLNALRSKYQDNAKELEEIKSVELPDADSSTLTTFDMIRQCRNFSPCSFLYFVCLVTLQQVGGANLAFSYIEPLYEHTFADTETEYAAVVTAVIGLKVLLLSWLLSRFCSHQTFLLISTFIASLVWVAYSIFLHLLLHTFLANRHAIYMLWTYIASQSISGVQFLPILQFTSRLPTSQLRAYGCWFILSVAIVAFYLMSILKLFVQCYVIFPVYASASLATLVMLAIFCYEI